MKAPDFNRCPALVFTPIGRDAVVATALLKEAGALALVCRDFEHFVAMLDEGICCAIVTDEGLRDADLKPLGNWVSAQPTWSDFPFIILTQRRGAPDQDPELSRLAATLGNATFIERPFHPRTFVSAVGTALRGRARQFEARLRIDELRESEARLHTALTAGKLGSWELDLSTFALVVSPACRAIFGHASGAPFTYSDLLAGIRRDDRPRMTDAIDCSLATGCDFALELCTLWPDGTVHWADMRARLVRDGTRKTARLVGVISDITMRKAAEDSLQQANDMLEARVAQRTAELERSHRLVLDEMRQRERAEELLRQVQKMEMIGQLTGGVAHDFNNLLMAIMANLELLRKQPQDAIRATRLIDGALRGAQRGAALTQRLLAFARQQDLKVEPTHLPTVVRGMTDLLERSIGPRVALELKLPEGIPLTLADGNQVELAILNLVVNARDAMPEGGTLSIAVDDVQTWGDNGLPAGEYVRIIVADTGKGMDADTLAKATEPFFTTKELGKGTGLGLSMIHGLALQLNGALRLESEAGRGTRVELWLPVTSQRVTTSDLQHDAQPEGSVIDPIQASILLVDDDALIATSTAYLLQDMGHEVIEADSGAAALEILKAGRRIDLLLTDYSMPRMTGLELALAARELRPTLPVILATGYAELPQGADVGIQRLRKPYQQHQLVAEIAKALTKARAFG
ncbi:ATP-binding protein [Paraburkholderia sp. BR14263]|uniref:ATP-binding protein n=1 Tax=unclassified Paraburkholderia TaxID=2615204 RepID=UPI0034CDDEF6